MSARFYDPGLGAFTQLDSYSGRAQDPLSLNRYLYAAANPASLIDPTGHFYMAAADLGGVGAVRAPTAAEATHNSRVQRYSALDQEQSARSQSMTSGATGDDLRASDLRTQMVSTWCAVDCSHQGFGHDDMDNAPRSSPIFEPAGRSRASHLMTRIYSERCQMRRRSRHGWMNFTDSLNSNQSRKVPTPHPRWASSFHPSRRQQPRSGRHTAMARPKRLMRSCPTSNRNGSRRASSPHVTISDT